MSDPRQDLCDLALHVYERRLTDAAGGNFSVRHGDRIYCTPKFAGARHWWRIRPEMIIVTDLDGERLGGDGEFSREWLMHLRIYQRLPAAEAVVHAHAENVMTFASMARPIPPTSEQTERWGTVELCDPYPSHTVELAESVVAALEPRAHRLPQYAIATLIPHHGITIASADLLQGFEALEGIDQSCRILAARAAFEAAEALRALRP